MTTCQIQTAWSPLSERSFERWNGLIRTTHNVIIPPFPFPLCLSAAAGVCHQHACTKRHSFLSFPYVCPEPVLVKCSFIYINGAKSGVFRTSSPGFRSEDVLTLPRQAKDRDTKSQKMREAADSSSYLGCFLIILSRRTYQKVKHIQKQTVHLFMQELYHGWQWHKHVPDWPRRLLKFLPRPPQRAAVWADEAMVRCVSPPIDRPK